MSIDAIAAAVATIREYTRIQEEAAAIIEQAKDALKQHMTDTGTEEINGNDFKVTWHTVNGTTFDRKALEADHPGFTALYTRPNPSRRFLLK